MQGTTVEKEAQMSRVVAAAAIVLGFTFATSAIGQDVKTKTKIKGDDAQTVTYTGCVQSGAQTRTFVLNKVVPVGQTTQTTTDASGVSSATTTTYALVPGDTVQITEYVGHKVEVTGMLVPKGEMTSKTKTKVGDDTKREEVKTDSDMPQFRVISIRNLAAQCE
jgi:hypothetical protein